MPDKDKNESKAAGGFARAEKMTKEQRSIAAKNAANARWKKDIPKASHEGVLKIGEIEFTCAIVNQEDGSTKRVISQSEFMRGLGMYYSGYIAKQHKESGAAELPQFLAQKSLKPFIESNIDVLQFKPFEYRSVSGNIGKGIPAEIIPKICEVWIDARNAGVLGSRQMKIAEKANTLHRGLAEVGVVALIDEATGYQEVRDKKALQSILDKYLEDHAKKWSKTFPDEFWEKLLKTKGQESYIGLKRPQFVGHWVNNLVYDRLAPGIKKKLQEVNPRMKSGNRKHRHHQMLTEDHGVPELKNHIMKLTTLMEATSYNEKEFMKLLNRVAPKLGDTIEMGLDD